MKKILPFIIIMSLLVPFIPVFDFSVYASDSVSDDFSGDGGGHNRDNHYKGVLARVNELLMENGYIINDDTVITFNVLDTILEDNFSVDLDDYVSVYDKNNRSDLPVIYNNFVDSNTGFDFDRLDSILQTYFLDYAKNNSYLLRSVIHVSDFLSVLGVMGTNTGNIARLNTLQDKIKTLINGSSSNVYIYDEDSNKMSVNGSLYAISRDEFLNYSFYIKDINSAFSDYLVNGNGVCIYGTVTNSSGYNRPSSMWVVSSNSVLDSLTVLQCDYKNRYYPNSDIYFSSPVSISLTSNFNGFYDGVASGIDSTGFNTYRGSLYIVADSIDIFSFPIFRDYASSFAYSSGNSSVYMFDKTVDLGDFAFDIDYSRLYDIISSEVRNSSGNIQDTINYVANNFLQQQLDLLHDINNALNDGSGQSWLRRIYGILDYNFPLTLKAFEDLINAVQNISVSGVGGDFSEATQVLHEIDTKLGILIDEPFTDLTDNDWNEMKSRIQTKFPFCIFSDIVAISVILNRPPQQPDLNFPIPILGSESENSVHIDLSPYDHARPYVHGALIFLFIIGLLALSVKIFDHLKS